MSRQSLSKRKDDSSGSSDSQLSMSKMFSQFGESFKKWSDAQASPKDLKKEDSDSEESTIDGEVVLSVPPEISVKGDDGSSIGRSILSPTVWELTVQYVLKRARALHLAEAVVTSIICDHPFSNAYIRGGGGVELKYISTFLANAERVDPPMAAKHPNATVWWRRLNEVIESVKYSLQLCIQWLKETGGLRLKLCEAA